MTKRAKQKPLTDDEIDEIVVAQVDDDDAWEEEITVTPVSRPRASHIVNSDHPAQRSR